MYPPFDFPVYITADEVFNSPWNVAIDATSNSKGADFYQSLRNYLVYAMKKYGEASDGFMGLYNPYDYGIEIYVEVNNGNWSRVYDIGFYEEDNTIDGIHELGGGSNNYVMFFNDHIDWGYDNL